MSTDDEDDLIFKALSHRTRRQICDLLKVEPRTTGMLCDLLPELEVVGAVDFSHAASAQRTRRSPTRHG